MSCCATARSPTRSGGGSNPIWIWKKRASPIANIARRRCRKISARNISTRVVPANAGTHTPCRLQEAPWQMPSAIGKARGYGSRRSPGRPARWHSKIASLRRRGLRPPDKPCRVAEALDHDGGQVLGLVRHAGAGAHGVAVLMRKMRWALPLLQRAGAVHHQFPEMQDAKIGRAEMFAGAVGDRALAVLHGGVLLGHALDAGVALGLLQLAVDQIVVGLVAQRHVILVDLGDHAVAAVISLALGLRQRTLRIPGIGIDPAIGVGDGHETLAENILARHRAR